MSDTFEGCEIIKHFTDRTKPLCIFGVLVNFRGNILKQAMLEWLSPIYDVITIEQPSPGSKFEYPALRYLKDNIKEGEIVLYIHTKGAVNSSTTNKRVVDIWKREFSENKDLYFNKFPKDGKPFVACPFASDTGITWFNGFFTNKSAMDNVEILDNPSSDRWIYEEMFVGTKVDVCGIIKNDINNSKQMIDFISKGVFNIEHKITNMIDKDILIYIFNYRNDDNARKLRDSLGKYFDVCVLDSGNDKKCSDFTQYPNIYYSGLYNEAKRLSLEKNYKFVGIICSDVTIDDSELNKFILRLKWLKHTTNIGVWKASPDEKSKSVEAHHEYGIEYKCMRYLEGWMLFMKREVFDTSPFVDLAENKYGWSLDVISEYIAHKKGLSVIMDHTCKVHHPYGSGYDNARAEKESRTWESKMRKLYGLTDPVVTQVSAEYDTFVTFVVPKRGRDDMRTIFEENIKKYFCDVSYKIIYVEQNDTNLFRLGQLRNIGAILSASKYVIFNDIDIVYLNKMDLDKIYSLANGHPIRLYDSISQITIENGEYKITSTYSVPGSGGALLISRKDWEKYNGYSNLFRGWGWEDTTFLKFTNIATYPGAIGHITHPTNEDYSRPDVIKNRELYDTKIITGGIQHIYDGWRQETFEIGDISFDDNITTVKVDSFGVVPGYKYNDIYLEYNLIDFIKEEIIVTLTSWKKRLCNLPEVLESLIKQTKMPNKIVVNLSSDEFPTKDKEFPKELTTFLKEHKDLIEVFWVDGPNYKNWKKTIPTLRRYPDAAIINVDDDFIYPSDLVEELYKAHLRNPNNPISGNTCVFFGVQCQCGCASLVKLKYLPNIFEYATDEVCKMNSDDIFFTYIAAKAGNPFVYCGKDFFINMQTIGEIEPLHVSDAHQNPITTMWNYMIMKHGGPETFKKSNIATAQPQIIRSLPPKTNKIFMPDVSFEERPDMLTLYMGTDFVYPFKGSNVQTVHAEDGSYSIGFKKFVDLVFENKYKWILCIKDTIRFIGNTTVSNKIKQIVNSESNIGIYTPSSLYANQNSPSKRQYKTGYRSVNEISDDMFLVNVSALNGMKDIDFSMCRTGAGFMKYLCSVVKGNGYSIVIDDSICYTKNFINTASDEVIERNSVWLIRENGIDTSNLRTPPIKTNIQ